MHMKSELSQAIISKTLIFKNGHFLKSLQQIKIFVDSYLKW